MGECGARATLLESDGRRAKLALRKVSLNQALNALNGGGRFATSRA